MKIIMNNKYGLNMDCEYGFNNSMVFAAKW